jgi:hypothetical protein
VTELIPLPLTGEALDLNAPTGELAQAFDRIRDLERELKETRDQISRELIGRMDKRASWTLREDGFKVSAPSPAPKTEYDGYELHQVVQSLVAEGLIDGEAAEEAVEIRVEYRPRVRGVNALRKLGSDVADRVDLCAREVEPVRRVRVEMDR